MSGKRWAWLLLVGLLLSLTGSEDTEAQFAAIVYDPTNFGANTITSAQSIITAANSVISVANQALELLPFDDIAMAADFAATVEVILGVLAEAEALAYDVQSIQAQIDTLFNVETAPATPIELMDRIHAMREAVFAARTYAMRVQTLLTTLSGAVGHVLNIINLLGALSGNMQGNQSIIQQLAVLNTNTVSHTAMTATWQRQDITERLSREVVVTSIVKIYAARQAGWPSF